jgi:hypothetical protein
MTHSLEHILDAANVADVSMIEGGAIDNASTIAGLRALIEVANNRLAITTADLNEIRAALGGATATM